MKGVHLAQEPQTLCVYVCVWCVGVSVCLCVSVSVYYVYACVCVLCSFSCVGICGTCMCMNVCVHDVLGAEQIMGLRLSAFSSS